jgi:hypothetical protein
MSEVARTLSQYDNGYWSEHLSGPGGSLVVECVEHYCSVITGSLLGRYHVHGRFVPADPETETETFATREGDDYPAHIWAALRGEPVSAPP